MKYKEGDRVFHSEYWHHDCKGYIVEEAKESFGLYKVPHYKVKSKETKSGFVWLRESMLR